MKEGKKENKKNQSLSTTQQYVLPGKCYNSMRQISSSVISASIPEFDYRT